MDTHRSYRFLRLTCLAVTTVCLGFGVLALNGCGGGAGGSSTTPPSPPTPTPTAKTAVQVNIGDSPADWMLAFSMNISSMSLTGSNGTASVVSGSTPLEMMHLMGMMQPLAMVNMPQGSYTGASVTIPSATVMYMDPTTKVPVQATIASPVTVNITFASPITVRATPMAMGFDLDLASSVTMSNGNLAINPVFHITSGTQGSGNAMDPANGGIQQMMGSISSVSGNSFVMTSMQAAQNFTFTTNSSTSFSGTSMGSMTNGMLVVVDASLQSDGSLLCTRIRSMMNSGGVMGGGIITSVTGLPATSLTMIMQNGAGTGIMSSFFASGVSITLSGGTTYQIDEDNMDMAGLPFTPVFDQNHIYVGQSVMPISSSGMMSGGMGGGMMGGSSMAGTMTASQLELVPQGLRGTASAAIASGTTTSFTLNLPAGCAFTTLTGATSVTVFQQPQTTVVGSTPIASGSSVHAYGLLFFDGGQWKMVASRMGAN